MTALYIVLGVLLFLLIVLVVPVRFRVTYQEALAVRMRVLFFLPFRLFDESRAEKKDEKKPKPKAEASPEKSENKKKQKKKSPSPADQWKRRAAAIRSEGVSALLAWLKEIAQFVEGAAKRLLRAVVIRRLDADVRIVGEDAAETALTCGRLCAAAYPLMGVVLCAVKTRHQNVRITPDFLGKKTTYSFDVRLSVSPWRVLWAALWALFGYMKLTEQGTAQERRYARRVQKKAEKKIRKLNKEKQTTKKEAS